MRILFTNDDGCGSQGLHAVADLFWREHEIAVVAPDGQRSGYSHSLTMREPVSVAQKSGYPYPVYAVGGTPVDCVKIAIKRVFRSPDIVVSGINAGRNLGSDIMYSGTVAAASEGAYYGIRSFALSLASDAPTEAEIRRAAEFFYKNLSALSQMTEPNILLNINFPTGEYRGVKAARMSTVMAFDDEYDDADGKLRYRGLLRELSSRDTDEQYCGGGYVTLTPLTLDRTAQDVLRRLKSKERELCV